MAYHFLMILINEQFITDHPTLFSKTTIRLDQQQEVLLDTFLDTMPYSHGMFYVSKNDLHDEVTVWFQLPQDLAYFRTNWVV